MRKALTTLALAALKPTAKAYYVSDTRQEGLRVRVAPSGAMTWNVAYRIKGEGPRSVSLGRCDPNGRDGLDLAGARERAAAILKAAREGRDLLAEERAEKQAEKEALTVKGLIDRYARQIKSPHRRGGPLRTAKEIDARLRRALQTKLDAPVEKLTRKEISELLDDVAEQTPREAEKRRQCIHAMFRWAAGKGYVAANPIAGTPTYGSGEPRDRALSASEIKTFWEWLDAGAEDMPPDVIAVLRLQLLTGARVSEVAGITGNELSIEGEYLIWTLPAARAKNKKAHTRPLEGLARKIVEAAAEARPQGALFRTLDGNRALTATDVGQALNNRQRPIAHFTTHDLRRTVVSHMDEMEIALDTIAAVVGHQRGTAATRTLIRHYSRPNLDDRVVTALRAWEARVVSIVTGKVIDGNVIRLVG